MTSRTPRLLLRLYRNIPFRNFQTFSGRLEPFAGARMLVRIYYLFLLYASVGLLPRGDPTLAAEVSVDPLWPVWWITGVPFPIAFAAIRVSFIVAAIAAVIVPERRLTRAFAAVALLEFVALYASALRLDVDWYIWVLTAFLFIFLPDGWQEPNPFPPVRRERFLLVFWGCQAANLLTYSMAGFGKVIGAITQLAAGEIHAFSFDAAARHVADRLLTAGETSILGPWVIAHPGIAWPLFIGSMYLLVFSFWIAFRPALHRAWGVGLILFHVVSYLSVDIGFSKHIFLNAILLVHSPFRNPSAPWQDAVRELPLIGGLAKRIWRT